MKLFPLASIPSSSRSRLFFPNKAFKLETGEFKLFTCLRIIDTQGVYLDVGSMSGQFREDFNAYLI